MPWTPLFVRLFIICVSFASVRGTVTSPTCSLPASSRLTTALSANATAQWLDLPHPDHGWGASNLKANQTLTNAGLLQAVALRLGVLVTVETVVSSTLMSTSAADVLRSLGTHVTIWDPADGSALDFTEHQLKQLFPVVAVTTDHNASTHPKVEEEEELVHVIVGTTQVTLDAARSLLCFDLTTATRVLCSATLLSRASVLLSLDTVSSTLLSVSPTTFKAPSAWMPCDSGTIVTTDDLTETVRIAVRLDADTQDVMIVRMGDVLTADEFPTPVAVRTVSRVASAAPEDQEFTFNETIAAEDRSHIAVYAGIPVTLPAPKPAHVVTSSWLWPIIDVCVIAGAIALYVVLYLTGRISLPHSMRSEATAALDEAFTSSNTLKTAGYGTCPSQPRDVALQM